MKANRFHNINITLFSVTMTGWFIWKFIIYTFGIRTRPGFCYGPYYLNEIHWSLGTVHAFLAAVMLSVFFYLAEEFDRKNGNHLSLPKLFKFKSLGFGWSFVISTLLLLVFFFIIAVREYYIRNFDITFVQFCMTMIPLRDILRTSVVFGIILAAGFFTPSNSTINTKEQGSNMTTNKNQNIHDNKGQEQKSNT